MASMRSAARPGAGRIHPAPRHLSVAHPRGRRAAGVGWLGCTVRVSGLLAACPRGNEGDGDIRPKNPTNLDPNVRIGSEQVPYEGAQGALKAGID